MPVKPRLVLDCKDPSLTKQEFKDSCDILHNMNLFLRTGRLPNVNTQLPRFGDFSQVPSYHDTMNYVTQVQEMFHGLPSQLRNRFSNDPGKFLDFCYNPENADELSKLGIVIQDGQAAKLVVEAATPKEEQPHVSTT